MRVKFFQAALLLPNLLSWVVIGFIAYAFLNADTGFINNTILAGLGIDPVSWYTKAEAWPPILIIVNLWKNIGYQSIVYMAAISGIDKSVYEAAAIDGASKVKQIFSITLPMLKPTVIILTLMSIGRIFYSDFGLFYQVPQNSGAIYNTTQTIDTYVYRGLIEAAQIDGATEFTIFRKVMLPLAVPTVATISLFTGLCYWNDWTNGLYYENDEKYFSIQLLLQCHLWQRLQKNLKDIAT